MYDANWNLMMCPCCEFSCRSIRTFARHLYAKHPHVLDGKPRDWKVACPCCGMARNGGESLAHHVGSLHSRDELLLAIHAKLLNVQL